MGSEEDASETSGIGSMAMPSDSGAINFQATPDSERKVRTECVPPPLPHCHSTPATASEVIVCVLLCMCYIVLNELSVVREPLQPLL